MSDTVVSYTAPSKTSRYKKLTAYLNSTNIYLSNPSHIDVPTSPDDKFFLVTLQYENRLDLISHKFYNDSKFWWVIAKANSLQMPFDIPLNTILRIPSTATLFGVGGIIGNA